ncbi:MAG: sulfate/thiosulfate transport system permease protein [Solirubrobacteraceae bacterium]|nr:sulfate/thiosulfate transport system permease protein [Solirubrobacteraceae bacterium]
MQVDRRTRLTLRTCALLYLLVLLVVPVGLVFYRTFEHGIGHVIDSVSTPAAISAFWLTIEVAAIAVPLNAIFGIATAMALARGRFPGKRVLDAFIDLPFAVSPVVIGISLVLLYGRDGWFGFLLDDGIRILFSTPGIVLATVFVSLPFVAREVTPVLREIGVDQELAAATLGATNWQTFWRITLPAIRWGLAYGIVLSTARAIGEFGAVSVISGRVAGETQTLTILVEQRYNNFDLSGAYAASALLALIALCTLLGMTALSSRREI